MECKERNPSIQIPDIFRCFPTTRYLTCFSAFVPLLVRAQQFFHPRHDVRRLTHHVLD